MSNEDIIKFINDNCRECNEVDREMYENCAQCGFLKKFLENKGTTTLHSVYGDFELNQPMPKPDNQENRVTRQGIGKNRKAVTNGIFIHGQ